MALTELINTAAAVTSNAFAVATPTSVVASGLASTETCPVLVEVLGGTYEPLIIREQVELDGLNKLILIVAPGNYKVTKAATAGVVKVAYTA